MARLLVLVLVMLLLVACEGSPTPNVVATKVAQAVGGATVYALWTLPNSSEQAQDSDTTSSGSARFTVKSNFEGSYEICVTDVSKEGYVYDPEQNVRTCATLMVN